MSELGIGVRVYVGWTPNHKVHFMAVETCGQTGTITQGPFLPDTRYPDFLHPFRERAWIVDLDSGGRSAVIERLLFPIGDDPETLTEPHELEATT